MEVRKEVEGRMVAAQGIIGVEVVVRNKSLIRNFKSMIS
jgi:hypothetical protein